MRSVPAAAIALVVAVPLAAQLACQPAVLLIDPSIPVYGVLANLLAEPAAPVATGLGLIGCLLAPWWPGGADVAIRLAAVPAWWIASIARAVATWPSPRNAPGTPATGSPSTTSTPGWPAARRPS